MPIPAKYPGSCTKCHKSIIVGQMIDWTKGKGASHETCPTGTGSGRVRSPRAAKAPSPPPVDGEQRVSRRSQSRGDGYDVGAVLHLLRVAGGGGPDGRYWVVVEQTGKWRDDDDDEWYVEARVRPATEEEAAPLVDRAAAREQLAALARDINALRGERVSIPMPMSAVVLVPKDPAKMCATGERIAIVCGVLYHERVGDPDMTDSWHHYVVRVCDAPAELITRVVFHIAAASA